MAHFVDAKELLGVERERAKETLRAHFPTDMNIRQRLRYLWATWLLRVEYRVRSWNMRWTHADKARVHSFQLHGSFGRVEVSLATNGLLEIVVYDDRETPIKGLRWVVAKERELVEMLAGVGLSEEETKRHAKAMWEAVQPVAFDYYDSYRMLFGYDWPRVPPYGGGTDVFPPTGM